MSTFTCDIDENATAQSFVRLGFTDLVVEVGSAITRVAIATTAVFLSAAAAASSVEISQGPILHEHAVAASLVSTSSQLRTTALSSAAAHSFVERTDETIVLEAGAGQSIALPGRDSIAESTGTGQSFALPSALRSLILTATASATSGVFGFNDYTYVTNGTAQSAVVLNRTAVLTLLSTGSGQSFAVPDAQLGAVLLSTGTAQSAAETTANLGAVIEDRALVASFAMAPSQLSAWVMNTETSAMSRYTRLPVESMAVIGGLVLGIGEAGLYEMAGTTDDDAPIPSRVVTGRMALGVEALKNLSDIVVSYMCAGVMQIRISCYGEPVSGTYTYTLPVRQARSPRANRLTPGKGMRSRYFKFEFVSDSAAFEVAAATVDVVVNQRRV